jgi:hypothetical protein
LSTVNKNTEHRVLFQSGTIEERDSEAIAVDNGAIAKRLELDCKAEARPSHYDCRTKARRLKGESDKKRAVAERFHSDSSKLQSDEKAIEKRSHNDHTAIKKQMESVAQR